MPSTDPQPPSPGAPPAARRTGIGIVPDTPAERLLRRSRIAWGVAVIALVFLMETWSVHQRMPQPASPYVWGLLVGVALAASVAAVAWGRQARRAG